MIYDKIDASVIYEVAPLEVESAAVDARIEALKKAIPTEDRKSKTVEMQEEVKTLRHKQRELRGKIIQLPEDRFKDLLADEYGLSRQHPKFEKVYGLAWQYGHSGGFSDVESYFSEFVELVK